MFTTYEAHPEFATYAPHAVFASKDGGRRGCMADSPTGAPAPFAPEPHSLQPAEADTVRFAFAFDPVYRQAARVFGISPETAYVQVGERTLRARYGRWLVQTPLTNITDVAITGPYRLAKTAGPPRLGITDRSLTFASNGDRGVCVAFAQAVWGIDRLGLVRHPSLTVTVAEVDRLASLLRGRADFAGALQSLRG